VGHLTTNVEQYLEELRSAIHIRLPMNNCSLVACIRQTVIGCAYCSKAIEGTSLNGIRDSPIRGWFLIKSRSSSNFIGSAKRKPWPLSQSISFRTRS
jgi:hypothetical protein